MKSLLPPPEASPALVVSGGELVACVGFAACSAARNAATPSPRIYIKINNKIKSDMNNQVNKEGRH